MGNDFFNGESILKPFFTLNIKKVKILKSPRTLQGQVYQMTLDLEIFKRGGFWTQHRKDFSENKMYN